MSAGGFGDPFGDDDAARARARRGAEREPRRRGVSTEDVLRELEQRSGDSAGPSEPSDAPAPAPPPEPAEPPRPPAPAEPSEPSPPPGPAQPSEADAPGRPPANEPPRPTPAERVRSRPAVPPAPQPAAPDPEADFTEPDFTEPDSAEHELDGEADDYADAYPEDEQGPPSGAAAGPATERAREWLEERRAARSGGSPPGSANASIWRRRALGVIAVLVAIVLVVLVVRAFADIIGGNGGPEIEPVVEDPVTTISIPEGLTRSEIAEVAREAGLRGNYVRATRSFDGFRAGRYGAQDADSLEGFLFPATYEVPEGAHVRELISRQLEEFERRISEINMRRARQGNLSVYDVVKIASMIEREIQVEEERRLASAVIYNRLASGEPLGIDATIRYALDNFDQPLTMSELESDDPYNTRVHAGLPPGPIGNPGEASLQAAARPANSDVRYYVVKPGTCGEHEFTETAAEHEAAVARYNQAREEAGGSPTEC